MQLSVIFTYILCCEQCAWICSWNTM